jgi:uncharacterized phage protein gp47/JayE
MAVQLLGFDSILSQLVSGVTSRTGLNSLYPGSTLLAILEQVAQSDYQVYVQIIEALKTASLDSVVGADLDNLGFQFGTSRKQAIKASGHVTITDNSFDKIATQIYAASAPPVVGDTSIKVSDASAPEWSLAGAKLYIGRGTSNYEGPIDIASVTPTGSFFTIALVNPLTKNHLNSESVILAQGGDRQVTSGTIVQTRANNSQAAVTFATQATLTLEDGEDTLENVLVVAQAAGINGNIGANAIIEFATPPFAGAKVTNPLGFATGADIETDAEYRARIKNEIQSLSRGTETALKTGIAGLQSDNESVTIKSSSIVEPVVIGQPATLYVSSDVGLEPTFDGTGSEALITNASGGEEFFQVQNVPVTRPQVVSTVKGPYGAVGGEVITVTVTDLDNNNNQITSTCSVTVPASFIKTPGAAQVVEIINALNAAANLTSGVRNFFARAAENSTKVLLFASKFSAIAIKVDGGSLNTILKFPTTTSFSLKLYKDDILLNQGPDYIFNRFSGQGRLTVPLVAGESLTAGSAQTRGFLRSVNLPTGTASFTSGTSPRAYIVVDAPVTMRSISLPVGTSLTVTQTGQLTNITAGSGTPFANVQPGDYLIIQSPVTQFLAVNQGVFKVNSIIAGGAQIEFDNSNGATQSAFLTTVNVVVKAFQSDSPPELINISTLATGNAVTLQQIVDKINEEATGIEAKIFKSTYIQLNSKNYNSSSEIFIVHSFDGFSSILGFNSLATREGEESQIGFAISNSDVGTSIEGFSGDLTASGGPLFTNVQDSAQTFNTTADLHSKVLYLDGNAATLSQPVVEINSNTQLTTRNKKLKLLESANISDLYAGFRTFDLDDSDQLVVVVDEDKTSKTFAINMYREGEVDTSLFSPTTTQFSGLDTDAATPVAFSSSFNNAGFFEDFKVWFKANREINPTGSNNTMRIKAAEFGPTGNNINIGIFYPSSFNLPLTAVYSTGSQSPEDSTFVDVTLASGSQTLLTGDASTQISVTNPGGTTWRYTFTGTGTNPTFNLLTTGEIINISSINFAANNRGIYRITATAATYFEVSKAAGTVQTVLWGNPNAMVAYPLDAAQNKASDIKTALEALGIVEVDVSRPGSNGTGALTLSSEDDVGIGAEYVALRDGEAFVKTYATSSPFFELKAALNSAPEDEDEFRLIPTTAVNVVDWLKKPAVTGLSIVANIDLVGNATQVQLSSKTLGRDGSINVTGAKANSLSTEVLSPAVDQGSFTIAKIPAVAIDGFHKGQFVKLTNPAGSTIKTGGFNTGTSVRTFVSSGNKWYLFFDSTGLTKVQTKRVLSGNDTVSIYKLPNGKARYYTGGHFTNAQKGDIVFINESNFNSANNGRFIITQSSADFIEILNDNAVTESVPAIVIADAFKIFDYDSFLADNDTLTISKPTGSWFANNANNGAFDIQEVKQPAQLNVLATYLGTDTFTVTGTNPYTITGTIPFTNQPVAGDFVIYNGATLLEVTSSTATSVTGNLVTGTTVPTNNTTTLQFVNVAIKVANNGMVGGDIANLSSGTLQNIAAIDNYEWYGFKLVANVIKDPVNAAQAFLVLDDDSDFDNISSTFDTQVTAMNKLGLNTDVNKGLDGYIYHTGILQKAQLTVDGSDLDPISFPGIKAAGVAVEVLPPIDLAVKVSVQVALQDGVTLVALSDTIRTEIISYINSLGIGRPVILSAIIDVVSEIAGVESVKIASTTPAVSSVGDRIPVSPNQKARVLLPSDVVVSAIGT